MKYRLTGGQKLNLAAEIRRLRRALRKSQHSLARDCHLDERTIRRIENQGTSDLKTLTKLASALGTSLYSLVVSAFRDEKGRH